MLLRVLLVGLTAAAALAADRKPPSTRTDNVTEVLHGVEVADPYRWLEDGRSAETREWLERQRAYARAVLDALPGRAQLRQRLAELMRTDFVTAPVVRGSRYFYVRRNRDQELGVICVRQGIDGRERVLVDPHPLSPDRTVSVTLSAVSPDGSLVAYGARHGGEDEITVKVVETATERERGDILARARYSSLAFRPDNRGLYYVRFGAEGPRLYYHELGSDPARDPVVFGEGLGRDKTLSASLSPDGRYLLIHVTHGVGGEGRTELYLKDLSRPDAPRAVIQGLRARSTGRMSPETLFVHTNWQAPNGRVLAIPLDKPEQAHWREIIAESQAVIRGFTLAGGKLFVNYLDNVVSRVGIFEPDGRPAGQIAFASLGTISGVSGEWNSGDAFFQFSSYHVPATVYRYHISSGRRDVWWQSQAPVDSERFELRQVWFRSRDGTRVPMFLLHGRGFQPQGDAPTLLTGYGGFNLVSTPGFDPLAVVWVERGGVYAVANLRGGGEFGEAWHRAGMLDKKQNVFDDFIAAAQWLISNRYTQPSRLAITGNSNGGLLVGAALTQRPDLFRAVICGAPLLDMLRYHKFSVARWWVAEYGSAEDPEQFQYLYAYSPYHRVRDGTPYPAVLFVTGDADTRVDPLHARKMTARLQAATSSGRPVLLLYDTYRGHSAGLPLSEQIENLAMRLQFLLWQLGLEAPGGG
ncbi:MAG: prolyl oligopeptidase family serine peptidase [Bryobacterales bacterium]|nr:prolyl oligopeptidase family serine peptidase [Bryobacterales bacterium]